MQGMGTKNQAASLPFVSHAGLIYQNTLGAMPMGEGAGSNITTRAPLDQDVAVAIALGSQDGRPSSRWTRPLRWNACDIARFLATAQIFQRLGSQALHEAAGIASVKRVRRGGFIFLEGEPIRSLHVLAGGSVKLLRETEDGRAVILRLVGPGEVFGIAGVGAEAVERFSAQANEDATILEIPRHEFLHLLSGSELGMQATLETFGALLRDVESRICDLQTQDAECRLARALIQLTARCTSYLNEQPRVSLTLTRQDLADLAGTNLSTASRTVSAWVKAGIIAVGRACVVIQDYPALRRIAKGAA